MANEEHSWDIIQTGNLKFNVYVQSKLLGTNKGNKENKKKAQLEALAPH